MFQEMTTTIRHKEAGIHAVVQQCESSYTLVVVFRDDKKIFEYKKRSYCLDDLKYIIDRNLLSQINLN